MVRRLTSVALVAAGLWLVTVGAQRWYVNRQVNQLVHAFMDALKSGNRERALLYLEPDKRALAETKFRRQTEDRTFWTPNPRLTYRIHHVRVDGQRAESELWIEKDGYVLKPLIHIVRSETGLWKIDHIEGLHIDPLWKDQWRDRGRIEGEELAEELAAALKGREGISVERVPIGAPNR